MKNARKLRRSTSRPCGLFLCTLPTLASILHLAEAEVWTLIVAGSIAPVGKTRAGDLIFDAAPALGRRSRYR